MSTVGYVTKRFPRLSETFILDEILGLEAAGVDLRLFAIADPHEPAVQPDVALVRSPVTYLRGTGWRSALAVGRATLSAHVRLLTRRPRCYLRVVAYIAAVQARPPGRCGSWPDRRDRRSFSPITGWTPTASSQPPATAATPDLAGRAGTARPSWAAT